MLYPKSHKDLSKSLVVEMMEDARESWKTVVDVDKVEYLRRAQLNLYEAAYNYKVYKKGNIKDLAPEKVISETLMKELKLSYPRQLNDYLQSYKDVENYISEISASI